MTKLRNVITANLFSSFIKAAIKKYRKDEDFVKMAIQYGRDNGTLDDDATDEEYLDLLQKQMDRAFKEVAEELTVENGELILWRGLTLDDKKKGVERLLEGNYGKYKGLGVSWSWENLGITPGGSLNRKETVILKASVPLESIDIKKSISLWIDINYYDEEKEFRLKPSGKVILLDVTDSDGNSLVDPGFAPKQAVASPRTDHLVYHGTSKPFDKLEIGKHSGKGAGSLYGDAIYATSSEIFAKSFAGYSPTSRVYTLDISGLKIFDCNASSNKKVALAVLDDLKSQFPASYSLEYITPFDLFSGIKDAIQFSSPSKEADRSQFQIKIICKAIKEALIRKGYDGVKCKQSDRSLYYAIYNLKKMKTKKVEKTGKDK